MKSDTGLSRYIFEDELVRISWYPTPAGIDFTLHNKTDFSVRIVWDEAALVDYRGVSQPVMHAGVKYDNCGQSKAPSVVVKRGRIEDRIIGCSSVRWSGNSWYVREALVDIPPLCAMRAGDRGCRSKDLTKATQGQRIQVLLPIQIEGVTNEYMFTFEVNRAYVYKKTKEV